MIAPLQEELAPIEALQGRHEPAQVGRAVGAATALAIRTHPRRREAASSRVPPPQAARPVRAAALRAFGLGGFGPAA